MEVIEDSGEILSDGLVSKRKLSSLTSGEDLMAEDSGLGELCDAVKAAESLWGVIRKVLSRLAKPLLMKLDLEVGLDAGGVLLCWCDLIGKIISGVDTRVLDTGELNTGVLFTDVPDTGALEAGVTDTGALVAGVMNTGALVLDTGALEVCVLDTSALFVCVVDTGALDTGAMVSDCDLGFVRSVALHWLVEAVVVMVTEDLAVEVVHEVVKLCGSEEVPATETEAVFVVDEMIGTEMTEWEGLLLGAEGTVTMEEMVQVTGSDLILLLGELAFSSCAEDTPTTLGSEDFWLEFEFNFWMLQTSIVLLAEESSEELFNPLSSSNFGLALEFPSSDFLALPIC